ncbi:MAG: DUF547 domain-containing protein [Geminicoccaceae bacterium]
MMTRRGMVGAALGSLLAVSAASRPAAGLAADELSIASWEVLWTQVLTRVVDEAGRIDFGALERDHQDLNRVVAFIAAVDPVSDPRRLPNRSSRLAFYINAYNALAMSGIVAAGVPQSLGWLRRVGLFYLQSFAIGGHSISLYDLENDVIRPMGEERVHFVLNCMVVGCPRLPRKAFSADALDRDLDAAARAFVSEDRNVRVDFSGRQVWLSAIFKFYTEDFLVQAPDLVAYVNQYRVEKIPADFTVRFLDYDWTVNDRARQSGS